MLRNPARVAGLLDPEGAELVSRALSEDRSSRPAARELYAYFYAAVPEPYRETLPPVTALLAPARLLAGVRSDAPSPQDMVRAGPDAEILADLIAANETAAPLAVALVGDWGSGKSSVMLQVQRRIAVLAEMSRNDPGRSLFAANIRQVSFNAWDYSDDQVWAGITEHLFRALAGGPDSSTGSADPGALREERARLRSLLREREEEEQAVAGQLQPTGDAAASPGELALLPSPAELARTALATVRAMAGDARHSWAVLLGWAVLGAAAAAAWVTWGPLIGAAASAAAAVLSPAAAAVRHLRDWQQAGARIAEGQRSLLPARQRRLQREITQVKERLAVADTAAKLAAFLAERDSADSYRQHRSLLGQVRADLGQLSEDLAAARREWAADGASGLPPLERIVLYIDDLDRCPPRKVVEVLEAVHLMLALDLFVVVVAVDARWLIRSLQIEYRDLFAQPAATQGQAAEDGDLDMATPADFLDKIFQVPFAVTRPSPGSLAGYLRTLFPLPP